MINQPKNSFKNRKEGLTDGQDWSIMEVEHQFFTNLIYILFFLFKLGVLREKHGQALCYLVKLEDHVIQEP